MIADFPPLALTMGEPAGIGGEIALRAWIRRAEGVPAFLLIDDAERLRSIARALDLPVEVRPLDDPAEAARVFTDALPVLHQPLAAASAPGLIDPANAPAVIGAIETAVALVGSRQAAAVVTNPIHKRALYAAGFAFPGHTEFLAALTGAAEAPVMMLASPHLRVVPVTVHVSLRKAIETLDVETIVHAGKITAAALARDFGIARPRLAVAGLNPHAGEDGEMGREDIDLIAPAVRQLRDEGIDAAGPMPPDTMFHERARQAYDAALCMYHDQALIPLKTLAFDEGVNVTLGLPLVRTSPDHGTALDIAGRGLARAESLIAALRLANDIAHRRAAAA